MSLLRPALASVAIAAAVWVAIIWPAFALGQEVARRSVLSATLCGPAPAEAPVLRASRVL